jgi:immune inhibitor A
VILRRKLLVLLAVLATAFALAVPAGARPDVPGASKKANGNAATPVPLGEGPRLNIGADTDNPSHPLGDARQALLVQGTQAKIGGKVDGPVAELAKGQFVELERQGEDSIWTVLGEFSETAPFGGLAGPLHNEIPEPDRSVDNATIWAPDFNEAYYEDLLFSEANDAVSMRNFYIEQSSNRYTVNGDVTDWGLVPFNQKYYGEDYCGGIVCAATWDFVNDSVDAWYNGQALAGMSDGEINAIFILRRSNRRCVRGN